MKKTKILAAVAALVMASIGMPRAYAAMDGHADAMAKMHMYFRGHSLGFPRIFYQFHPGPHWDLMHARALHLTARQIQDEKRLAMGMMRDTRHGVMALQQAYRRYRAEARLPDPSIAALIQDVRAVGRAQAYLGYEMIPSHVKGYRVLDPMQQAAYHRLARANWMHIMRMMHR